jgi:hypothetical protein
VRAGSGSVSLAPNPSSYLADYYEGEVSAGRYLVTVDRGNQYDARGVFTRHGGYDRSTAPKA